MTQPPIPAAELRAAGLTVTTEAAVLTVTLDKPQRRNSQTPRMWRALAALGRSVPESTRVVVVRGAGDTFSAGLDTRLLTPEGIEGDESVAELMHRDDQHVADTIGAYQEGFTWLADPAFVSIAAVQGYAIGAGFQLALACDLRVLADDAQLCMKEPALGLVPDLAGTKPLVDLVGYSRALEICATARFVDAQEAGSLGIATTVVPRGDLEQATGELVQALQGTDAGAVRSTKTLLQRASVRDLHQQRLAEREAQVGRFRALTST